MESNSINNSAGIIKSNTPLAGETQQPRAGNQISVQHRDMNSRYSSYESSDSSDESSEVFHEDLYLNYTTLETAFNYLVSSKLIPQDYKPSKTPETAEDLFKGLPFLRKIVKSPLSSLKYSKEPEKNFLFYLKQLLSKDDYDAIKFDSSIEEKRAFWTQEENVENILALFETFTAALLFKENNIENSKILPMKPLFLNAMLEEAKKAIDINAEDLVSEINLFLPIIRCFFDRAEFNPYLNKLDHNESVKRSIYLDLSYKFRDTCLNFNKIILEVTKSTQNIFHFMEQKIDDSSLKQIGQQIELYYQKKIETSARLEELEKEYQAALKDHLNEEKALETEKQRLYKARENEDRNIDAEWDILESKEKQEIEYLEASEEKLVSDFNTREESLDEDLEVLKKIENPEEYKTQKEILTAIETQLEKERESAFKELSDKKEALKIKYEALYENKRESFQNIQKKYDVLIEENQNLSRELDSRWEEVRGRIENERFELTGSKRPQGHMW